MFDDRGLVNPVVTQSNGWWNYVLTPNEGQIFTPIVADKYVLTLSKILSFACDSWPCSADHCLIMHLSFVVGRFAAIQRCPESWWEKSKDSYLPTLMCIVLYGFHFDLMKKTFVPQEMISFLSKTHLPILKIQLKCINCKGSRFFFSALLKIPQF